MTDLNDRLDAAIDDLMAGKALPSDPELKELLTPARALMEAPIPAPAQRTARVRMNAALDARRNRKGLFGLGWLAGLSRPRPRQWAPVMTIAVILLIFVLANFALPGQLLYPVKQIGEALGFLLPRTAQAQADYYIQLADRRLTEMERLAATGRPVPAQTLTQFQQAWEKAMAIPGIDETALAEAALEQATRLKQIIPQLPPDLQDKAQDILNGLMQGFQIDTLPELTPTPLPPGATPSPTPTPPPNATATPPATATATPPAGVPPLPTTNTPEPGVTPAPTSTPIPGQPTPSPAPGQPSPSPTFGPPAATPTPTQTPNPFDTPPPTATPPPPPAHLRTAPARRARSPHPLSNPPPHAFSHPHPHSHRRTHRNTRAH